MNEDAYEAATGNGAVPFLNVGAGQDIDIKSLAMLIKNIVGFKGDVMFDGSKPDGTPRKLLDMSRLKNAGWSYAISLETGVRETYHAYMGT